MRRAPQWGSKEVRDRSKPLVERLKTAPWVPMGVRIGASIGPREANGCRLWTGALAPSGYPIARQGGETMRISRIVLGLKKGDPRMARHRCDEPLCVEPSHLEIGTHRDNMDDAVVRGRMRRGEEHPTAALTDAVVREIRRLGLSGAAQSALAVRFGVDQGTISRVLARKTWRHVEAAP